MSGLEALRREIEALRDGVGSIIHDASGPYDPAIRMRNAVLAILDRLPAAAPSPDTLSGSSTAPLDRDELRCGQCGDDLLPEHIEGHLNAEGRTMIAAGRGMCWFCEGEFVIDALIAGYDTWEESRLACLACNERMQGKWRLAAASPDPAQPDRAAGESAG